MAGSKGTILVVDDDSDTASVLAEALRRRGFATSWVCSARECLDRLAQEPVDVVVTDIQMPESSGIELCRELGERHPDVVPLVITGQSRLDMANAAIRAGAYDFITKPVTIDALEVAVSRAIAHLGIRREVLRLRALYRRLTTKAQRRSLRTCLTRRRIGVRARMHRDDRFGG